MASLVPLNPSPKPPDLHDTAIDNLRFIGKRWSRLRRSLPFPGGGKWRSGLPRSPDGNLSVHARKLEDAEYTACTKSFEGRLPQTEYRRTDTGRSALERYLEHMAALIHATRSR